jgi:hypothetical protein
MTPHDVIGRAGDIAFVVILVGVVLGLLIGIALAFRSLWKDDG